MDLKNLLSSQELIEKKDKIKKIFFYRICGTGMGACACLLKEQGFEVSGADQHFYPPMSHYLESTGIELFKLHEVNKEFLQKFDLIVVGNSVPGKSEHARLIEQAGTPFASFPQVLGALLLKDKTVIGVAGTHGKTTTTYFLKQMLNSLDVNCGYFIGGVLDGAAPSSLGDSEYFVIESDEYDSAYFQKFAKFKLYEVDKLIVTSLEFDHGDIYESLEQIEDEFRAVLPKVSKIVANNEYASIAKLGEEYKSADWTFYGPKSEQGPIVDPQNSRKFKLKLDGDWVVFETSVAGFHNILNISASILVLHSEGFPIAKLQHAVRTLSLVKRRQEYRGKYKETVVIDDFAHHPRAIEMTIEAIKESYPDKRIVTVFEPVSATARSDVFQKEFVAALSASDQVVIAQNPMPTTAIGKANLDCDKLVEDLKAKKLPAVVIRELSSLEDYLDQEASLDKLFLILSNRSCLGLWESSFVKNLN